MPVAENISDLIATLTERGLDVRADLPTCMLYSTDASIYQVCPQAVVIPRHTDELQAVMEACARYQMPITARGAGSSLGGQAIGPGVVLDCSRLNRIDKIDPDLRIAIAEPGVVLNALNRAAAKHGLMFGPDPASAERATLGGSLGNNAAGAHSIRYGMFVDHLLSAEVVLGDGGLANLGMVEARVLRERLFQRKEAKGKERKEAKEAYWGGFESSSSHPFASSSLSVETQPPYTTSALDNWQRAVLEIRERYAQSIRERWPKTWRRASGYALNYLLPWSPGAPAFWDDGSACSHFDGDNHPYRFTGDSAGVGERFNLAHLLGGSEGTLALVRRMTLRLVSIPKAARLVVIAFPDMVSASAFTPQAMDWGPSAVELIPGVLVKLARAVPAYAAQLTLLSDLAPAGSEPPALLAVEFAGDDPAEVHAVAQRAASAARRALPGATVTLLEDKAAQSQVWTIRKIGLGLIMSRPSDWRPYSFIEDMAVPVERLAEFVAGMEHILNAHGVQGEVYGHASAGCLHIRPILNLKTSEGVHLLRRLSTAAAELTFSLGGSISGEHGDGMARSEWYPAMFGPEIMEAFHLLKRAADPHDLLNPGKMVSASDATPIGQLDENLRFGADYAAQAWQPVLHFEGESGLATAIEHCNGAGVCRKAEGTMCPSFQATHEEMHSTRGRANLLRWLISGQAPSSGDSGDTGLPPTIPTDSVFEALDLCLACKGCKAECPSGVDVAKLKYEFMHLYYQSHTRKLRDYLFGYIHVVGALTHRFAPLVNPFLGAVWFRKLFEGMFGVSSQRRFPQFSTRSLAEKLRIATAHSATDKKSGGFILKPVKEAFPPATSECGFGCSNPYNPFYNFNRRRSSLGPDKVLYLSDPFTEYMQPEVGQAAVSLLQAAGCTVVRLPVVGAGRTLISKGFLSAAKKHAVRMLRAIAEADPKGELPVVGVEPSEVHALLDEYLDFFPDDAQVQALAKRAWTVEEFLLRGGRVRGLTEDDAYEDHHGVHREHGEERKEKVLLHGHCYQKARPAAEDGLPVGVKASVGLLEAMGYAVEVVDDGCCGMAGAFGYEKEHYAVSMQVGELALFPAVRAAAQNALIAAAGVSCREQILDGTQRNAIHPVVLAWQAYTTSGGPSSSMP